MRVTLPPVIFETETDEKKRKKRKLNYIPI